MGSLSDRKSVSLAISLFVMLSSIIVFLPEVSSPAAGLEFSRPNIRVDQTSERALHPSIAVDDNGILHAVWEDDQTGGSVIRYSNSSDSGLSWSPEVTISFTSPGREYYKPEIAIDLTSPQYGGSIYVVYEMILSGDWSTWISYSRDGGSSWNVSPVDHGGLTVRSQQPAIGVAGNGSVYVAWKDGRMPVYQIYATVSHDGGITWASENRVSVTDEWNIRPSIAIHGSDVYIIWQENYDTYYSAIWGAHSSDGMSWSASRVSDSQTLRIVRENPDVEVANDGSVLVVWAFREQDTDWIVEFSRSDDLGATWTDPVRVDHGGSSVKDMGPPRVSAGGGNIYVVWFCDGPFFDESVYFTYSADGGMTWGDRGRFSLDVLVDDTHENGDPNDDDTHQKYPALTSDGYEVFIVWQDERSHTTWQVYFAKTLISSLQLTEIRDSPDGQEAVEIFNYGGADWNLAGIVLRIDGHGDVDLSALGTLPPSEHRTIGDSPSMDLSVDIALDDEGGFVALVKGVKYLDVVAYGQRGTAPDPLEGESVARHWTGLRYIFDWLREPSPSFGSHNDVPVVERHPRLVLNEVLFNPLLSSDAFVEIMLIEGDDIDTNGYLLICDSVHILSSVVLTKQNPTFATFQSSDPSFFSPVTSSGDNIYLYDSSGRLLDMVGWDTSHTPGLSTARVPEGNGTHDGYDDESSTRAGWDFDANPTPSVIGLGPDQWKNGNAGETVSYDLVVANRGSGPDFIDIAHVSEPNGWIVGLFHGDGITPLTDSPADGDGVPDTGLVGSFQEKGIVAMVTIPLILETQAYENTTVYATSSTNPSLFGEALLVTRPYPSVAVNKSLHPGEIYVETAGPGHEMETTITLEVKGTGSSLFFDTPQDVVFLIDMSSSIGSVNFTLEKTLALTYLKQMRPPDRAAVVFFDFIPTFKGTLTGDYEDLEWELRSEHNVRPDPEPCTRIGPAIEEAAEFLFKNGNDSHDKIIFLFTDGLNWWFPVHRPPFNDPHPWDPANWSSLHNISIFPIGIRGNQGGPARWLLEEIASITGTRYVFANSSRVMDGLRDEIGLIENSVALYDQDMDDGVSLVQDALPSHIHYVSGSAIDPRSGMEKEPSIQSMMGKTFLSWDVPSVHVGQTWLVSFKVTCSLAGHNLANVPADSRAMGLNWNDTQTIILFPTVYVDCLLPPPLPKPYGVSAELEGASFQHVNISWNLSPAEPGDVDYYRVYYGWNYDPMGTVYAVLGTTPPDTGQFIATNMGEGDPSTYFFRVCAIAVWGEKACADTQAAKFTQLLSSGPNLVSIPLIQSDESIETVLQTVQFDKAWHHDSSTEEWKWYMTSKTYRRGFFDINHTMGIWVNVTEDSNLTVAGVVPALTTIHLHEGWNLVSFPSFDSSYTVNDLKAEIGATRVEGYDPAPPTFLRALGDAELLLAGEAYWVEVNADVDWVVEVS